MKVATRIVLFSSAVVLTITAGLSAIAIANGTNSLNRNLTQSLGSLAEIKTGLIAQTIELRLAVLQELANEEWMNSTDFAALKDSLAPDVQRLGYLDFGIVDAAGNARYVIGGNTTNLSDRLYVKKALAGTANVSDVLISKVTNTAVVMFAVPIKVDGVVKQALIARADGNFFSEMTNSMGYGEHGYAYLINSKGVVVAHNDRNLVMNQFDPISESAEKPELKPLAAAFEHMIADGAGTAEYDYEGKKVVNGFARVAGTDWILSTNAIKSDFTKPITNLRLVLTLSGLGFLVLGVASALVMGRAIARPIARTSARLGDISGGGGDLTQELPALTRDELGTLASSFNRLMGSLRTMIASIKVSVERLSEVGQGLSVNMTQTSASIVQISANIESVNGQIQNQAAGVHETLATVEQITRNLDLFNAKIERQTENVNQASSAVEEMVSSIHSVTANLERNEASMAELLRTSADGKDRIEEVVRVINEVVSASEGMMEANSIIAQISDQTNMLAMNAAIEAAHAGDAGKGFAVVADEIRRLAENSAAQTKSIADVLGSIKRSIDEAVSHSKDAQAGFEQVLDGVKKVNGQELEIRAAMKEQSVGGTEVLQAINGINTITREIRDGSAEILQGGNAILAEMNQLMEVTQMIGQSVGEMSVGTREINDAIVRVTELSQENKESISAVDGLVSQFKV